MKFLLLSLCAIICIIKNASSQVEFDSSKCVNAYQDEIKKAISDTCMVSFTMGCEKGSPRSCTVSKSIGFIKNLYELVIQTNKLLHIEEGVYNYKYLWAVFIKGKITKNTFPKNFFSSPILNSIMLTYVNDFSCIPRAILNRKPTNNICALIIFCNQKKKNNSSQLFSDIKLLIAQKKYDILEIYHCNFEKKKAELLEKLAKTKNISLIFSK